MAGIFPFVEEILPIGNIAVRCSLNRQNIPEREYFWSDPGVSLGSGSTDRQKSGTQWAFSCVVGLGRAASRRRALWTLGNLSRPGTTCDMSYRLQHPKNHWLYILPDRRGMLSICGTTFKRNRLDCVCRSAFGGDCQSYRSEKAYPVAVYAVHG
jgi:hypothetical protein